MPAETQRQKALSAAHGKAVFREIFAHSPEAIALTRERDSTIVEVNEEWCRLTGFKAEDAVGRTALELGHWHDAQARGQVMNSLRSGGRVTDADVTLVMQDGMPRVVRMNAALVHADDEAYILIYLRDVTAERLAQEAMMAGERVLEETNEKLNRQVRLYELTEAVAQVGHWFVYPGESVVHWSKGFAEMMGETERRVAPLKSEHLDGILEEDRDAFWNARRQMDGQTVEYRWRHPDGSVRWVRSRMHRQFEHGVHKADIGIAQDITPQREAIEQLKESEHRFRSLTELSSDWFWEQDENFRFVKLSGNLESGTGIVPESVLGKTRWESGVGGVSAAEWELHRAKLQAHQVFHDFEVQRQRKDGSWMWASISGAPVFDSNGTFKGYRGTGRDITSRKQSESDIERLAFFDALTGLPNRRLLLDRLNQALTSSVRRGTHGALLFIDLDNFKTLNDTMGHHMGDELLKQVATRLGECVRGIDTVARLGGDEFVVMLEELSAHEDEAVTQADAVGKKALSALNLVYDLAGQQHHSSPSIGVTLFFADSHSVDDLLKRADLAMYQAKGAGRNTLRFFDPAMQATASLRASIEADLRQALVRNEFVLFYQPVMDEINRVTGVEALIRWNHPQRGLVPPGIFIPVAEQSGLILQIGQWVLETACAQLVAWRANPATEKLTMAVNVSARQFRHPEFSEQLLSMVRLTGVNPYRLKLELTESLLVSDFEDAIAKMGELRSIGVSFSLDDFGTGYSSLAYLRRLPLDQLKIDQSFVRDVLKDANSAAIVRTILSLAENLDLGVVAEGVETVGQRDFLLRCGCKAFQGYLFSRPVPIDQLAL